MKMPLQVTVTDVYEALRKLEEEDLEKLVKDHDTLPIMDEGLVWVKLCYGDTAVKGGIAAYCLIKEALKHSLEISRETYEQMRSDLFQAAELTAEKLGAPSGVGGWDVLDGLVVFLGGLVEDMAKEDRPLFLAFEDYRRKKKISVRASLGAGFVYDLFKQEKYRHSIQHN